MCKRRSIFAHLIVGALAACGLLLPFQLEAQESLDPSQVQVQFRFEPNIVEPGTITNLTLSFTHEIRGNQGNIRPPQSISIPKAAGLETQAMARSSSTQTTLSNLTAQRVIRTNKYPFRVRAQSPGFYTIPPFVVEYGGATFNVAGATLEVIDTSNNAQAAPVIMELVMPQEQVYVGETVKATIQIWVKEEFNNYQIQGINKIGTAFSEGVRANQEIRSRATRGGAIYNVNSWPVTVTPIKGGEQTIQYEARVRLARGQNASSIFDVLSQPFGFRSRLNQSRDSRTVTVNSEPRLIPVKPLPLKSQPDIFSGAIGDFGLKVAPTMNRSQVGIPIKLNVDIIGQGNFNRIQAPPLDLGRDWKTFEPESEFQGGDALNYSGGKRFTYTLIPTKEEVSAIPPVRFSYFDPVEQSYKMLKSGVIPVEIEPNPDAENFDDYFDQLEEQSATEEANVLADLVTQFGRQSTVPTPLALAPAFQWTQLGALLLVLSGFGLIKARQKLARDERRKQILQAKETAQKFSGQADNAMNQGDPKAFILASASEIRAAASAYLGASAEAWTATEFDSRLKAQTSIPEKLVEASCQYLNDAENALFRGDSKLDDFQYSSWKARGSQISSDWLKFADSTKKGNVEA